MEAGRRGTDGYGEPGGRRRRPHEHDPYTETPASSARHGEAGRRRSRSRSRERDHPPPAVDSEDEKKRKRREKLAAWKKKQAAKKAAAAASASAATPAAPQATPAEAAPAPTPAPTPAPVIKLAIGALRGGRRKRGAAFGDDDDDDDDAVRSSRPRRRRRPLPGAAKPAPKPAPKPVAREAEGEGVDALEAFKAENAKELEAELGSEAAHVRGGSQAEVLFNTDTFIPEKEAFVSVLDKGKSNRGSLIDAIHANVTYEPFRKDFYVEAPAVAAMTREEVAELRESRGRIRVRGKGCPRPVLRFSQCGLSSTIMEVMVEQQFFTPTPIQAQAIPVIMSGRDLVGIAKTGSGKTLAFLLPLMRHVMDQRPVESGEGPIALVIAPTRELAVQLHDEVKQFARAVGVRSVCVYGGSNMSGQIKKLRAGAEVVVCTPGRMIDLLTLNRGNIVNLKRVTLVVLDEADRMFDMGFEPQVMRIVNNTRPDRQTVLFSATFPYAMESLALRVLTRPIQVVVGGRTKVPPTVEQHIVVIEEEEVEEAIGYGGVIGGTAKEGDAGDPKFLALLQVLGRHTVDGGSVLVFVSRQDEADLLFKRLRDRQYVCDSLHAGKDQADRISTIADFKMGALQVMVATSVAARGLDVRGLDCVVNYDCPSHLEDYVHRVGRTGRAGRKGDAYTFVTTEETHYAPFLAKALKDARAPVPQRLTELVEEHKVKRKAGVAKRVHSGFGGRGFTFDADSERKHEEEKKRALASRTQSAEAGTGAETSADGSTKLTGLAAVEAKLRAKSKDGRVMSMLDMVRAAICRLAKDPTSGIHVMANQHGKVVFQGGVYCIELEFNDYPIEARTFVTRGRGEDIRYIVEDTDCAVSTRGTFYPQGRKPKPGDRKLYLLIEGKVKLNVERCHRMLRDKLEEIASLAAEGMVTVPGSGVGAAEYKKYTVV